MHAHLYKGAFRPENNKLINENQERTNQLNELIINIKLLHAIIINTLIADSLGPKHPGANKMKSQIEYKPFGTDISIYVKLYSILSMDSRRIAEYGDFNDTIINRQLQHMKYYFQMLELDSFP